MSRALMQNGGDGGGDTVGAPSTDYNSASGVKQKKPAAKKKPAVKKSPAKKAKKK